MQQKAIQHETIETNRSVCAVDLSASLMCLLMCNGTMRMAIRIVKKHEKQIILVIKVHSMLLTTSKASSNIFLLFSYCRKLEINTSDCAPTPSAKCHRKNGRVSSLTTNLSRRISNAYYATLYKPHDWSLDKDIHLFFLNYVLLIYQATNFIDLKIICFRGCKIFVRQQ
jgi:hypothetical protein